jgi:hypothetical protein
MIQATVHLKEDQFRYLAEKAAASQRTVEDLLSEIVEEGIAWRQALADDPVAQLFGTVNDQPESVIDEIVYDLNIASPDNTAITNDADSPH